MKQQLQLKTQRLRWYGKRIHFYRQSKILKTDAKKFYGKISKNKIEVMELPLTDKLMNFVLLEYMVQEHHKIR